VAYQKFGMQNQQWFKDIQAHQLKTQAQRDEETRQNDPRYQAAIQSGKYEEMPAVDPVTGKPLQFKWDSMLGADGNLAQQYQLTDQANTQALDKFRGEAMRDAGTSSAWGKSMLDQNQLNQINAMDAGNQQIAGQNADIMSRLAQTGGMGQGSRERMFRTAGRDAVMSKQRTLRDSMNAGANIRLEDEKNRVNQLGQTVNMDQSRASYLTGIQQTNTGNAMNERDKGRIDQSNRWNKEMETWGANKQADAQAKAACFPPNAQVKMADGQFKAIKDIKLNDEVYLGGKVFHLITAINTSNDDIYNYNGVEVTGGHAVFEDGEFIRVNESKIARKIEMDLPIVYNITTDNHVMFVRDVLFADYEEVDVPKHPSETLKELTENFKRIIS